jgi:cytochrome c oxidase subunit 5b
MSSVLARSALRAARPLVARSALRSPASSSLRAFSTTLRASSDHGAKPPSIFGPGGKTGEVPTDFEQATGLERFELLGDMMGIDVFDETPLDSSRVGTKKDPIMVLSYVRMHFSLTTRRACPLDLSFLFCSDSRR